MNAKQLFQAGKLQEAIQALNAEVRSNPTDPQRRTFLFELLCFAGEFDRAAKQLDVLSRSGPSSEVGALLYKSALAAERERQELFANKQAIPQLQDALVDSGPGVLNGKPFKKIEDADSRLGARLEVFIAGEYLLIPFKYISSFEMGPPRRLRDLIWATAVVKTRADFAGKELGEVLCPILYSLSWKDSNDNVKLGRATEWQQHEGIGSVPVGQKLLVLDDEEVVPLLEVRDLQFSVAGQEAVSNAPAN